MSEHTIERVVVNGVELALHRFGPRAAPRGVRTVLLLHGFLDAAATWDLVAEPLAARGYEVIAPDLRGFGESARVPTGGYYHFPDYLADMDDLVDAIGPSWLGIVGHSMGGGVATLYAGARPERVQRLVVMEGLGPTDDPPELGVERARRWLADRRKISPTPRAMRGLDEAVDRLSASHPRIPRELLRTRAERLVRSLPDGGVTWAWDPLHRTTSPTPFNARVYASFLKAITCPTLFVSGGPAGWHPPDEEERLSAFSGPLERLDLPEAGHMMHWTQPVEVAQAIDAFFARDGGTASE